MIALIISLGLLLVPPTKFRGLNWYFHSDSPLFLHLLRWSPVGIPWHPSAAAAWGFRLSELKPVLAAPPGVLAETI